MYVTRTSHDIFQTAGYHCLSVSQSADEAWLAVYGDDDRFIAWPYVLQSLTGVLTQSCRLRDVTSVYGYSGPVQLNCAGNEQFLSDAWMNFLELWRSQSVVTVFTRFHPVLCNHRLLLPAQAKPAVS